MKMWPKVVVVGDSQVGINLGKFSAPVCSLAGKSSLIITAQCGAFPHEYVPSVADTYSPSVRIPEKWISWWDTACSDPAYDRLRPIGYDATDFFLVLFAVNNPYASFELLACC
jgi:GTPase SAR1 family protein